MKSDIPELSDNTLASETEWLEKNHPELKDQPLKFIRTSWLFKGILQKAGIGFEEPREWTVWCYLVAGMMEKLLKMKTTERNQALKLAFSQVTAKIITPAILKLAIPLGYHDRLFPK